jgi:polyisoprenoid-binding protein YceI
MDISPALGRHHRPADLREAEVTGVLVGVVRSGDGWPLPGAVITVVSGAGTQAGRAFSDAKGAFTVHVTQPGPVTAIVSAPGMQPAARSAYVATPGPTRLGDVVLVANRGPDAAPPGVWTIDPPHTIIRATARHLALTRVEGRFTRFAGQIRIADPLERSSVDVSIESASIDTGNADRDRHLRSADFLDAERFPTLAFRSTAVTLDGADRGRVRGVLSIRDIEREEVLDAAFTGSGADPWGGFRIALSATTQLARADYEINWNMGVPGGLLVVGPTLRIDLQVQAVRQDGDADAQPFTAPADSPAT